MTQHTTPVVHVAFLLLTVAGLGLLAGVESAARLGALQQTAPAGKLFVDTSGADYIEVVDLASRRLVDKVRVGAHPHGLAFFRHQLGGRSYDLLYVTVESTGELVVLDTTTHRELARLPVGKVPNQLTLTRDGRFAYIPLRDEAQVAIIEVTLEPAGTTPRVGLRRLKRLPIGEWPHNSYTGARTGHLYVTSFRGGSIHVFDPARHEQLYEIPFPGEVRPVALARDESRAYVAESNFHGFLVVDVAARSVTARVELPPLDTPEPFLRTYVHGLTLSADERELWVTSCAGAAVYVYSLPNLKLQARVATGKFPHWFAWEPDGRVLWVSQMESDQVSAIDTATRTVLATLKTGPAPRRIVVAPPR
jgi:YVTN family beta-propeller protein